MPTACSAPPPAASALAASSAAAMSGALLSLSACCILQGKCARKQGLSMLSGMPQSRVHHPSTAACSYFCRMHAIVLEPDLALPSKIPQYDLWAMSSFVVPLNH